MIILNDNFNAKFNFKTYMALGSFDGFHYGHMELAKKLIEKSQKSNTKSLLYTFKNHPLSVIEPGKEPKHLASNEEKIRVINDMGIDIVNFAKFDSDYMKIQPETFVENLCSHYNIKGIVVGFNNRFGYKNKGDVELLLKLSNKFGFEVDVVEPVKLKGEVVSSSRIRMLLSEGNIEEANLLLKRAYSLTGRIVMGRQLGRQIGFPTANLSVDEKQLLPKGGVYFTNVLHNNRLFKAITNIGYNPTVNGNNLTVETHIIDFNENIYNKTITVYFIKKIRAEKKFESLEFLVKALEKDKIFAKNEKLMAKFI